MFLKKSKFWAHGEGAQGHGPFGPMGPGGRLDLKGPGLKDPGPMGPGAQGAPKQLGGPKAPNQYNVIIFIFYKLFIVVMKIYTKFCYKPYFDI